MVPPAPEQHSRPPSVVREVRLRRLLVEPPRGELPPWDPEAAELANDLARCTIAAEAWASIVDQCRSAAQRNEETIGFLVGRRVACRRTPTKENRRATHLFVAITRAITGEHRGDTVSVRFTSEGLAQAAGLLSFGRGGRSEQLVGWYHSHLELGCFLSDRDLMTHAQAFPGDDAIALVVDPLRREARAFARPQSRALAPAGPVQVSWLLITDGVTDRPA